VQDISDLKQLQNELELLASSDSLTGVANRRYFMELAEREICRAQRYNTSLALLMIDIDFFKHINDTYGHIVGDRVIKNTCELLKNELREIDTLGRLGGEEFGVLLPETKLSDAIDVAERMRAIVESNILCEAHNQPFGLTISLGIAVLRDGDDVNALIHKADQGLYLAKNMGRNTLAVSEAA
jgi:diguanylate cyclase (GGDEF)-like protein